MRISAIQLFLTIVILSLNVQCHNTRLSKKQPKVTDMVSPVEDVNEEYAADEAGEVELLAKVLQASGVKIDKKVFHDRVLQLSGIDLSDADDGDMAVYQDIVIHGDVTEYVLSPKGGFLKHGQDLLPEDQLDLSLMLAQAKSEGSYIHNFVNLNKVLFLDDASAAQNFVSNEYLRDMASDMVVYLGYEKNAGLREFVISYLSEDLPYPDSYITGLVFYNNETIRYDLLSEINTKRPEVIGRLLDIISDRGDELVGNTSDNADWAEATDFLVGAQAIYFRHD